MKQPQPAPVASVTSFRVGPPSNVSRWAAQVQRFHEIVGDPAPSASTTEDGGAALAAWGRPW